MVRSQVTRLARTIFFALAAARSVFSRVIDKTTTGDYPRDTGYLTAAVNQAAGLLVLFVAPYEGRAAATWTYDPAKNIWKDVSPKLQPPSVPGAGFAYDPFHQILLLQSGKHEVQYGGPDDSITWS